MLILVNVAVVLNELHLVLVIDLRLQRLGHFSRESYKAILCHHIYTSMFEGTLLTVDSLLLLELFQSYFLFHSLVALQEVTRAHKLFEVFGGHAI